MDKTAKKVVEYIKSQPDQTYHANRRYTGEIPFPVFQGALVYLEALGIVEIKRVSGGIVSAGLTHYGRFYREIIWSERIDFFKRSILCPVVVTILTEAVIHGLPRLLEWLLLRV